MLKHLHVTKEIYGIQAHKFVLTSYEHDIGLRLLLFDYNWKETARFILLFFFVRTEFDHRVCRLLIHHYQIMMRKVLGPIS